MIIGIILVSLVALTGLYLALVMPARLDAKRRDTFSERNYAHRGLFDNGKGVPENSLAAFQKATDSGYGCELDVQFTRDKKLIVFHDNDLRRACGVDAKVWELTWEEIRQLPLFGTDEHIPLFRDVLKVIAGREPLIVEIKAEERNIRWYSELCMAALEVLREYDGPFCVESFHPYVVGWFKRFAPDIVRGQLIYGKKSDPEIPFLRSLFYTNLFFNWLARPHFIAINHLDRNLATRLCEVVGGSMTIVWTIKSPERYAELLGDEDAVIFDTCLLPPRYEEV